MSIVTGKTCWVLFVDALVLNMDGNVLDALALGIKAALADTRIPKVRMGVGVGVKPRVRAPACAKGRILGSALMKLHKHTKETNKPRRWR